MRIKFIFSALLASIALSGCNPSITSSEQKEERIMTNESVYLDGVDFSKEFWSSPDFKYVPDKDYSENIKALYIRSDYEGQESYAFSFLGFPENMSDKNPAVLLLHGGGGTAYHEWVQEWTARGFIALAVDLEGHVPLASGTITDYPQNLYEKSPYVAPSNSNLSDGNKPIADTWLYYACQTAIISNSFLHNLAEVDPYKVGVVGISWGGFITSIISGYDDRFAYSIPIYCTVEMADSGTPIGSYVSGNPVFKIFDSSIPLTRINTPIYIVISNTDIHQNVLVASEVAASLKNGYFTIIPRLPHSHFDALYVNEVYTFAKEATLSRNLGHFTINEDNQSLNIELPASDTVATIDLYYTDEQTINTTTTWFKERRESGTTIILNIPRDATYAYITIVTTRGITLSSNILKQ